MAIYYMKFKYSINKYITGYTSIAYWWQTYEFVKRNLNQLLSNKLAEKYSWLGKKHKRKFYELKLAEMLIGKQN